MEAARQLFVHYQGRLDFIEAVSLAAVRKALETAAGHSPQAGKAAGFAAESAKSLSQEAALLSKRDFLKWIVGGVVTAAAGVVTKSLMEGMGWDKDIVAWVRSSRDAIKQLFKDEPLDIQKALELLLKHDDDDNRDPLPDDMMNT